MSELESKVLSLEWTLAHAFDIQKDAANMINEGCSNILSLCTIYILEIHICLGHVEVVL